MNAANNQLRKQAVDLCNHLKNEVTRDNNTHSKLYESILALSQTESYGTEQLLPTVSDTLNAVEGIMNKFRVMIDLHLDICLREFATNMRVVCKDQAELAERITSEMRASLWCYMRSLHVVHLVIASLHQEKCEYARKARELALMVKRMCKMSEFNKTGDDSKELLNILATMEPVMDDTLDFDRISFSSPTHLKEIVDESRWRDSQVKENGVDPLKAKQLLVDQQIQYAIEAIESMEGLTEEEKDYRKQELLRSRAPGPAPTVTQGEGKNAAYKLSTGVMGTQNFIEQHFVAGVGFVDRVNVKKLERHIRELEVITPHCCTLQPLTSARR